MTCTFFGHKDTPDEVEAILQKTLVDLVEKERVDCFYVGNNGAFDFLVRKNLRNMKKYYNINYYVVLAYMPVNKQLLTEDYSDTIYPEGLEKAPMRFAIVERNKWMLKKSDVVVCYVNRTFGGAYRFCEMARKENKRVINLV